MLVSYAGIKLPNSSFSEIYLLDNLSASSRNLPASERALEDLDRISCAACNINIDFTISLFLIGAIM